MKVLVLTAFYPVPNGTHERMFVHVRNQYYVQQGIEVTVLNFDADRDYEIDGIKVISLRTYEVKNDSVKYNILISHSANLRNHYKFIKKYEKRFKHFVFFFHGHEVMYMNRDYPRPYSYLDKGKKYKSAFQNVYDFIKIFVWKQYYKKLAEKSEFIFVSNWLWKQYQINANITEADLRNKCHIINNSIGAIFEQETYNWQSKKVYDFITIRSNLDGSAYCIDVVVELAKQNPNRKFLVIGNGKYFDYNRKPDNIDLINKTMKHKELLWYLELSKCAVMLTKHDTQGVMTCELAAYGIPVITSDIEVCHEIFGHISNVKLIGNDVGKIDLSTVLAELAKGVPYPKDKAYFADNTIAKEIELYRTIVNADEN